MLLLWIASYLETRSSLWSWAGFGLLFGFSALTTPVVLTVVPFLGGWVCYRLHRNGKDWKMPALTAVLVLIATVSPWMVRNSRLFHRPVFLEDNFWMEVCVGNLGDGRHWWNDALHPAGSNAELAEFRQLGEMGYMIRARKLALAFIWEHPGTYLWRCVRRFVFIWTGFWSFDREYLREEPFDVPNIFFCTAFTVLAMTGLCRALRSSWSAAMPYVLILLAFPVAYYVAHPEISFRQPVDPLLVMFASFAVFSRSKTGGPALH
jgi:hypothetical protein